MNSERLERIVVAVDPAVSYGERSDETGIIVAGRGDDGCGYVLDDLTLRASPDSWAWAAVSAYHSYQADLIVAEVNNGGDLVSRLIKTIDPKINYKAVRASRGKHVRAEPIAALYEQERIFHVRQFTRLEDEMCNFTADEGGLIGDDRVDALVWALTELMLSSRRGERGLVGGFRGY